MIDRFMDRYRGNRGLFGWLVMRLDVRHIRKVIRIAREIKETNG